MKTIRIFLLILIIIGLVLLFTQSLWVPNLVNQILAWEGVSQVGLVAGAGAGEHCGGNMLNASTCATGYHCAPAPGSHLPFGDVGGICVPN